MSTTVQERYDSYVRFCNCVGVTPLSFERWALIPQSPKWGNK